MAKIITAAEAADLIQDGMTLGVSGFGAFASPDYVMEAMSRKFKEQNTPRDLTIVSGVAPGDFVEDGCGLSKIKDEGIIKTLIASHLRMSPAIGRACSENKIAAFSMPLGVYGQLLNAPRHHYPRRSQHLCRSPSGRLQDERACKGRRQRDGGAYPRFREGLPFLQSIPH